MTQMRAALYDSYGGPEVLYEGRVPAPEIAADEVLVHVEASTVNGGELAGRAGKVRFVTGRRFPQRIGIDFVGDVVAVGSSVTEVREGERVWGIVDDKHGFGAAAEYVALRADRVATAPRNLTAAESASLVVGGTTVLVGLREKAGLKPGERLLVRGGSGGVGSLAVQVGRMLGAHVTALASGRNAEFVRELGADEVIDYTTTDIADLGAFDVIIDTAATRQAELRRHLAPGGRMVAVTFDIDRMAASLGVILASTVFGSRRIRFFRGAPERPLLEELTRVAESGEIRPVVDRTYALADIADAHRALEAGGVRGKIVIDTRVDGRSTDGRRTDGRRTDDGRADGSRADVSGESAAPA